MSIRRITLALLAVGLISSACWVSVWAWAVNSRDLGGVRTTVASFLPLNQSRTYGVRVTGTDLLCVDIDSHDYHACDPTQGFCPPVVYTDEYSFVPCDLQVTITGPGGVAAFGDDQYDFVEGFEHYDPFVCTLIPAGTATYTITVSNSPYGSSVACTYYLMTITSTPWISGGVIAPIF